MKNTGFNACLAVVQAYEITAMAIAKVEMMEKKVRGKQEDDLIPWKRLEDYFKFHTDQTQIARPQPPKETK